MRNVANEILASWYQLLHGVISVPVYRTDAPNHIRQYVLLRFESDTDGSNNQEFVTNPVVITEIVVKFTTAIDDGRAIEIDNEIGVTLKSKPGTHNLPPQLDIQIVDVRRSNATYINEDDGTDRIHRLITRNLHKVVQLVNES
jgi:hypothetical protein